jgi:hypothetical protein
MVKHLQVLQLNCHKSGGVLMAAIGSSLKLGANLVLIQEAPVYQGWRYPMYDYIWGGRVMMGIWRDSVWRV